MRCIALMSLSDSRTALSSRHGLGLQTAGRHSVGEGDSGIDLGFEQIDSPLLAGIVCRQSAKGVNALRRGTPRKSSHRVGQQRTGFPERAKPRLLVSVSTISSKRRLQRLDHGMSMAHKERFQTPPTARSTRKGNPYQTDGEHSQGGTHLHAAPKRGINFGIVETLARGDLRFQVAIPLL